MVIVILRAMAVLKCAYGIESAAKRPLKVLRRIPTEFWNVELQRLFDLMSRDVVALSGGGFFTLTKSLFLVVSVGWSVVPLPGPICQLDQHSIPLLLLPPII